MLQEMIRLPPPTVFCSSCWQAAAHSPVPNRSGQKGIFQSQEGCQRVPTPPPLIVHFAEPHTRLPRAHLAGTFLPPQSALCSRSALTAQLSVNKRALWQDARQHSAASSPRRVEIASYGRNTAFAALWGAKRAHQESRIGTAQHPSRARHLLVFQPQKAHISEQSRGVWETPLLCNPMPGCGAFRDGATRGTQPRRARSPRPRRPSATGMFRMDAPGVFGNAER